MRVLYKDFSDGYLRRKRRNNTNSGSVRPHPQVHRLYELIQTYHKFGETENESLFFFSPLSPRKGIFIPSILSVHKPVVPNVSQ